jgi:hypothetical protein
MSSNSPAIDFSQGVLAISIAPVVGRPGRFDARVGGVPLLDGARALLAVGFAADAAVVMRHRGAGHDALRSRVGAAARLTVAERSSGGTPPRFALWVPPPCSPRATPPVLMPWRTWLTILERIPRR